MKFQCPCCGELTLPGKPPGTHFICEICDWEDDELQFRDPNFSGGANLESLETARRKFVQSKDSSGGSMTNDEENRDPI